MAKPGLWLLLLAVGACALGVSAGKPKYKPRCPLPGMDPMQRSGCILCTGGRVCADFETDVKHCGRCFQSCQASEVCSTGVCVPAPASPSPSPNPGDGSACVPLNGNCSSNGCCSDQNQPYRCFNGICVNSNINQLCCGDSCQACPSTPCLNGVCQTGSIGSVNRDIRELSTCAADTTPTSIVSKCTEAGLAPGVTFNITRQVFSALGIYEVGSCISVSMCEIIDDGFVGPGNFVDLSWTPPPGVDVSTITTCGAGNCNNPSSTLLSRINVVFSNQSEELVTIISRSNTCLMNLAVRLTRPPDCVRFGGLPTIGGH